MVKSPVAVVLASAVLALGCRSKPAPSKDAHAPAPVALPAPPPSLLSVPVPGKKELTPAERAALARYQRAFERGRLATRGRDFKAAEAAYGEALVARPGDALALAERGYERLLNDRLEEAETDLNDARGHVSERKLEAQICYNLGLIAEKRGKAIEARQYFACSLDANATAAARKKLVGKSTCPAWVEVPEDALEVLADWLAAWKTLEYEEEVPASAAAAKAALSITDCSGGCGLPTRTDMMWHLAWEMPDGHLAMQRNVIAGYAYRCGSGPVFEAHEAGAFVWVSVINEEMVTGICDIDQCTPELCMSCCWEGTWRRLDYFIDKRTYAVALRVEQTQAEGEKRREAQVELVGEAVRLSGNGCDWTIPLAVDAGSAKGLLEPPPAH